MFQHAAWHYPAASYTAPGPDQVSRIRQKEKTIHKLQAGTVCTGDVGSAAGLEVSDTTVVPGVDTWDVVESAWGLKEIVSQPADRASCIEIVAIHGLNGRRDKTWTDPSTKFNWLSDDGGLRNEVPLARIMTFGYNSRTYFSRSNADVTDFASELLAAIKAKRTTAEEKQLRIVFLCHFLGGIVFKQVVIRAYEQDTFYSKILGCIQGVVLFGTPHRGSSLAFRDNIGTRLVRVGTLGYLTTTKLSKDLKINAFMLKSISESFVYRGTNLKIRSFCETLPMKGLNSRVVEKDSATLGWSNELCIASPANHSTVCKFPAPSDARYQTAISAILEIIEQEGTHRITEYSAQERLCLQELSSDSQGQLGQVDDHVPGTCEWVLSHNIWQQWQRSQESCLLWITADAGCGKSIIAKFLVKHLSTGSREYLLPRNICHFFFKEGLDVQDNAASTVSSLLHQIYRAQPPLFKHAMKRYTSMSPPKFKSFSTLWSVFLDTVRDDELHETTVVLDGLTSAKRVL